MQGHTTYEISRQHKYGGAITDFGEIVWARTHTTKNLDKLDQRCVEVAWAGKAEGSDVLFGLEYRGAKRFRAARRAREQHMEVRDNPQGCWALGT